MSRLSGRAAVAVSATVLFTLSACGSNASDDAVSTGSGSSTGAPQGQPDEEGSEPAGEEATGFYLPGELPDGWRISFEQVTNPWQELCPCETGMWRGPAGETIKTFTSEQQGEPDGPHVFEGDTTVHRDIPGGYLSIEEGQVTADWFDGQLTRAIFAEGVDADIVQEMAAGWTGGAALSAPDGFDLVWSGNTPAIVRRTEFFWRIFRDGDHGMVVHVEPWMYDQPFDPSLDSPDVAPITLEGNGLTLRQAPGWDEPAFEGVWPGGASITVATNYGEINSHALPLTQDEMLEVAGGFRPVSGEEWAAYIEQQYGPRAIEACRPLLVKPRLADLLVGPDDADADLAGELWEVNDDCSVHAAEEDEAEEITE